LGNTCLSLVATMLMVYLSLSLTNLFMYQGLSSAASLPCASLQILFSHVGSGSTIYSTLAGISSMSRAPALWASSTCACSVT
jgi:hypothetical protein